METQSLLEGAPFICCCCSEIFPNMVSAALLGSGLHQRQKNWFLLRGKKKKHVDSQHVFGTFFSQIRKTKYFTQVRHPAGFADVLPTSPHSDLVLDCIQVKQVNGHTTAHNSPLNHLGHRKQGRKNTHRCPHKEADVLGVMQTALSNDRKKSDFEESQEATVSPA